MKLRHAATLVLAATAGTPARAHPGPHEHMAFSDALAHAVGPFHLGLLVFAGLALAAGIGVAARRRAAARRIEKERRS